MGGRKFVFEGDVAADVADAEAAIVRLDSTPSTPASEALARLILRAECVASARIEGLEVGGRRLLRADTARRLGDRIRDVTADEVLGSIDAMDWGVRSVGIGDPITLEVLLELHRLLLAGTRLNEHGGRIRSVQNWIGGSHYNPCSAGFVPPPPEAVDRLLRDLMTFCNDDSLPALAQAAVAHAQFETIHPFIDGNGRTGRALSHLVLRRRGLGMRILPPTSLVLDTWPREYLGGLTATRYVGNPDSIEAREGIGRWIALFAAATHRAVEDAGRFEERIRSIVNSWHQRLGSLRSDAAARLLIDSLAASPVLTVATAADLIGRSFEAANRAVDKLVDADVLVQITAGRRNRTFEAPELIDAFADLDRQLASSIGDTRVSAPARPVPRRRG